MQVYSDKSEALASHHFLLEADFDIQVAKHAQGGKEHRDISMLRDEVTSNSFTAAFAGEMQRQGGIHGCDLNQADFRITTAFQHAAQSVLPLRSAQPKRPCCRS